MMLLLRKEETSQPHTTSKDLLSPTVFTSHVMISSASAIISSSPALLSILLVLLLAITMIRLLPLLPHQQYN